LWSCRRGNERAAAAEQAFGEARFRKAAALWGEAAAAYARSEREKAAAAARAEAARAREARREARREEERRREADRHAAERKAEEERMAAEEAAAAEAARLESARLESDRLDAERADAEGEAEESRREEGEAEWTAEAEAEWMMEEGEWMAGEETEWPAGGEEEEAADDTVPLWPEEGEDLSAEPAFAAVLPDDTDVPPVVPAARPAGETKTVTLPGGATMEMAWCPPGTFTMGSPGGEEGKDEDETPHAVTLTKGFWLAKTEVTQRQWRSVTGSNPSFHPGDDFPVENVSWNDCREFCRKAGMRLPTEAEWEYACRAGSAGAYAGTGKLEEMGWSAPGSGSMTHPAGEKRANAWGLHDMHGNAWEWCADGYQADLGTDAATDPAGPAAGETRVMRGGSFINGAGSCRAASRSPASPDSRNRFCGFRPVVEEDFP
jgi:formylglycine-generating enzyme required for sulfatase activity